MRDKSAEASITVFLSMVCILFLALICAVTESARTEGARAQSAAITGMGTFSLLSEFEPKLLEKYGIFALDAGRSGSFEIGTVNQKLETYLQKNVNPKERLLSSVNFDPWQLSLSESRISAYTLLTDESGEAFYQQAVSAMIHDFLPDVLEAVSDLEISDKIREQEDALDEAQKEKDEGLKEIDTQVNEELRQSEEAAEAAAEEGILVAEEPAMPEPDPELQAEGRKAKGALEALKSLRNNKGILLSLVTWGRQVSDEEIQSKGLPSTWISRKGTLPVEKEYSGFFCNVAFREYLLKTFPNFTDKDAEGALKYQAEYLIVGKKNDTANVKRVMVLLLAIREASNWASCNADSKKRNNVMKMSEAICSLIPAPGAAQAAGAAVAEAILLAWAFAESLLDLRVLFDGGKVPFFKTAQQWKVDLDSIGEIQQIIMNGSTGDQSGLSYKDYLRLLLNFGRVKKQRMRALDLIQADLRGQEGMENFKAENCIVAVKAEASYTCRQVFFSLPRAVMGIGGADLTFSQTAGLSY